MDNFNRGYTVFNNFTCVGGEMPTSLIKDLEKLTCKKIIIETIFFKLNKYRLL